MKNLQKNILSLLLFFLTSGILSLIYWRLVVYHGTPMIHFLKNPFDGETAYQIIFLEIFLFITGVFSIIFFIQLLQKSKKKQKN